MDLLDSNEAFNLTVANNKFIEDMRNKIFDAAKNGRFFIECKDLSDSEVKFLSNLGYKIEPTFIDEGYTVFQGHIISWNKILEEAEEEEEESDDPKNLAWWW